MNPYNAIVICSFLISCITVIFIVYGQRHTASTDYVAQLEKRIEALERELHEAEEKIKALEEKNGSLFAENVELMRRLIRTNGA